MLSGQHHHLVQSFHFAGAGLSHAPRGEGAHLRTHGALMLASELPKQKPLSSNLWPQQGLCLATQGCFTLHQSQLHTRPLITHQTWGQHKNRASEPRAPQWSAVVMEHVKCGQPELRHAVSIKCTLEFEYLAHGQERKISH